MQKQLESQGFPILSKAISSACSCAYEFHLIVCFAIDDPERFVAIIKVGSVVHVTPSRYSTLPHVILAR